MAKEQLNKGVIHKLKSRNPKIEFDKLRLYFRDPYVIDVEGADGKIVMKQPSIGDIVILGEQRFYHTLNIFITNTTAYRLQLWDQGKDWNETSDFELFIMLLNNAEKEIYETFLPDIDFSTFGIYEKRMPSDNKSVPVLYDTQNKIEINEEVYFHISQYLRTIFNIFPEEKITYDSTMKRWFIEKDRRELKNLEYKRSRGETEDSGLLPLISACCNHPGFKYRSDSLRQLGLYQFYDSVKRLQVYESTTALQKGLYSGMIDGSKIKAEEYNFMKPI